MIIIIIAIVIITLLFLPSCFRQWSDMDYVKHLEDMGEFTDENGREKR